MVVSFYVDFCFGIFDIFFECQFLFVEMQVWQTADKVAGGFRYSHCCKETHWLDSIAVSVFVFILVDIDKHCISSWDEQACLPLAVKKLTTHERCAIIQILIQEKRSKCWQLYWIRLVYAHNYYMCCANLPIKLKDSICKKNAFPKLFTPTCKYFYTDIHKIRDMLQLLSVEDQNKALDKAKFQNMSILVYQMGWGWKI